MITSSALDSVLMQALTDEIARHESAIWMAFQRALREQRGNSADHADEEYVAELREDPYKATSIWHPNPIKTQDRDYLSLDDVDMGKLNELPQCHRQVSPASHESHIGHIRSHVSQSTHDRGSLSTDRTIHSVPESSQGTSSRCRSLRPGGLAQRESLELSREVMPRALSGFFPVTSGVTRSATRDSFADSTQSPAALFHIPGSEEVTQDRTISKAISRASSDSPRVRLQTILQSSACEYLVTCLIVANAVIFGYNADYSVQNPNSTPPTFMRGLDLFFAVAFAVELLLRILAYGRSFIDKSSPDFFWNIFDTLLVVMAVMEEGVMFVVAQNYEMSSVRMLRLLRLVRIVRVIRLVRSFRDLRLMILGIVGSMKPFLWALILLGIIMYVFGVVVLQVVTDELAKPIHNPAADLVYYSSLLRVVYSLYMCIAGGISWVEVAEPLIEINPIFLPLFTLYIAFSVFCVLNIVTALFLERSSAMALEDEEHVMMAEVDSRRKWMQEIENIFGEADTDGSGDIQWEEFKECLADFKVQACMKKLGVDMQRMNPRQLWETLDFDNSGALEIHELAGGLQKVHGNAKSIDIYRIRHEQKKCSQKISKLGRMWQANYDELAEHVAARVSASVVRSFQSQVFRDVRTEPFNSTDKVKIWCL